MVSLLSLSTGSGSPVGSDFRQTAVVDETL